MSSWFKWVEAKHAVIIPGLRFMLLFSVGNWGIGLIRKDGKEI